MNPTPKEQDWDQDYEQEQTASLGFLLLILILILLRSPFGSWFQCAVPGPWKLSALRFGEMLVPAVIGGRPRGAHFGSHFSQFLAKASTFAFVTGTSGLTTWTADGLRLK